jgi:hypothetical protein
VLESVTFDQIYELGHTSRRTYDRDDMWCPFCGNKSVWEERGEGDHYLGPNEVCASCGASFHVVCEGHPRKEGSPAIGPVEWIRAALKASGAVEKRTIEQTRAIIRCDLCRRYLLADDEGEPEIPHVIEFDCVDEARRGALNAGWISLQYEEAFSRPLDVCRACLDLVRERDPAPRKTYPPTR